MKKAKQPAQDERVTITVRIPVALKRKAAVHAAHTDADLQDVVKAALEEYLAKGSRGA